ncbi:MAG: ankyrin repeat domain-containing protein [Rhizobiaceae bacterium]
MKPMLHLALAIGGALAPLSAQAQTAPSPGEAAAYVGLLRAAHLGDAAETARLAASGGERDVRDGNGRTAVHVAAFASHEAVIAALAKAGADMNAFDNDAYDAVTIAAVANDPEMLDAALAAGNRADNITSRYIGTALIAAAHLGHHEVVSRLIAAGAPLDHVNNLGWTALIEAVVLGDGGPDHQKTVAHLVAAGADRSIADRDGRTPLELARARGYGDIARLIEAP